MQFLIPLGHWVIPRFLRDPVLFAVVLPPDTIGLSTPPKSKMRGQSCTPDGSDTSVFL